MRLSERIYNAFLGGIVNKVVLAEWFTDAKHLEAKNEALREHFNAHLAVENGLASMDLHNEAVDRLTKARDALLKG